MHILFPCIFQIEKKQASPPRSSFLLISREHFQALSMFTDFTRELMENLLLLQPSGPATASQ